MGSLVCAVQVCCSIKTQIANGFLFLMPKQASGENLMNMNI